MQEFIFTLEFHISYLALRKGPKMPEHRTIHGRPLRESIPLPLSRQSFEEMDFFYEAQISVLVTGVDEWLWTSYCFVDTYHGSEPDKQAYLNDPDPVEPATGGSKFLRFPMWSPRDFFLCVLDRRMMQATREFKALVDAFKERMDAYVGILPKMQQPILIHRQEFNSMFEYLDDENLTRMKELKVTISTIRTIRDRITRTVRSWNDFEAQHIKLFELGSSDPRRPGWNGYLSGIRGHIRELQAYETILTQKLELFYGMSHSVSLL